jgi:hypothetical protein
MKKSLLIILILLWGKTTLIAEQHVRFSLCPAVYRDNNIFEKIEIGKVTDDFFQISLRGKGTKNLKNSQLKFSYLGNVQDYFQYDRENKTFHQINFDFIHYVKNHKKFSITGLIYRKNWFSVDKSYTISHLAAGLKKRIHNINYSLEGLTGKAVYSYFPDFDNYNFGLRSGIDFYPNSRFCWKFFVAANYFDYAGKFIFKPRFEHNVIGNVGFEYGKKMILGASIQAIRQQSNYDFLSYNSFVVNSYLSAELGGFYWQVLVRYNLKKYTHTIDPNQISLVYPDPEANINNQIFIGLERKIWKKLELDCKAVFFSSEYRFQADFYEKFITGIGLKYSL